MSSGPRQAPGLPGDVLLDVTDGVASITLNRPEAINALNHDMTIAIDTALAEWADDPEVRLVLLTGAGERGLCAGGDIVSIYEDAKAGGTDSASGSAKFWRDEYVMNARIARYRKPFVAIMDGIVMGGGVGLSAHGNVRIVTERSKIGMPEVGIGFVPDVGGTYLLARTPGQIGLHVALTTARMSAGDAIAAGFADHFVPSDSLNDFVTQLRSGAPVDGALAAHARPAPESALIQAQSWIDAAYSADDAVEIVRRLRASGVEDAVAAAAAIEGKSPVSVAVTVRSVRNAAAASSLEQVLNEEYRVSVASLGSADLTEGIRAQVIDKDRNPSWTPATLADVTAADVDRYFAPLGDAELGLLEGLSQ